MKCIHPMGTYGVRGNPTSCVDRALSGATQIVNVIILTLKNLFELYNRDNCIVEQLERERSQIRISYTYQFLSPF